MTDHNHWTTSAARDPKLRASDADRDAVAEILREQHGQGRLDTDELQGRIDRCYDAKTLGELRALLADLPGGPSEGERTGGHRQDWRVRLMTLAPLLILLGAISIASGRHAGWLAFPLIFLTIRLAAFGRGSWRRRWPRRPDEERWM